jgi:hypothetical protein
MNASIAFEKGRIGNKGPGDPTALQCDMPPTEMPAEVTGDGHWQLLGVWTLDDQSALSMIKSRDRANEAPHTRQARSSRGSSA